MIWSWKDGVLSNLLSLFRNWRAIVMYQTHLETVLSQAWWHACAASPATWETQVGGSLEARSLRPPWATLMRLHSKKEKEFFKPFHHVCSYCSAIWVCMWCAYVCVVCVYVFGNGCAKICLRKTGRALWKLAVFPLAGRYCSLQLSALNDSWILIYLLSCSLPPQPAVFWDSGLSWTYFVAKAGLELILPPPPKC